MYNVVYPISRASNREILFFVKAAAHHGARCVKWQRLYSKGEEMKIKKFAVILASVLAFTSLAAPVAAMADSKTTPYVSLGADLSAGQRATVLKLLGVTEDELTKDTTVTVTNADEHKYLDGKVSASLIGTKALSSCKVEAAKEGNGIKVETYNITYVTDEMYENALATAGMKNANVVVAGPVNISGTAALVGAMEAYSKMNGEVIEPTVIDGATDELVTTGEVAKDTGDSEKTTQLVAAAKQVVAEKDLKDPDEIGDAVDDISKQLEINLSDKDRQLIIELMEKLSKLDLDTKTLTSQASKIYDKLKSSGVDLSKYGISEEEASGFFTKIVQWVQNLFK